jgi:hypothetical protein
MDGSGNQEWACEDRVKFAKKMDGWTDGGPYLGRLGKICL